MGTRRRSEGRARPPGCRAARAENGGRSAETRRKEEEVEGVQSLHLDPYITQPAGFCTLDNGTNLHAHRTEAIISHAKDRRLIPCIQSVAPALWEVVLSVTL